MNPGKPTDRTVKPKQHSGRSLAQPSYFGQDETWWGGWEAEDEGTAGVWTDREGVSFYLMNQTQPNFSGSVLLGKSLLS